MDVAVENMANIGFDRDLARNFLECQNEMYLGQAFGDLKIYEPEELLVVLDEIGFDVLKTSPTYAGDSFYIFAQKR